MPERVTIDPVPETLPGGNLLITDQGTGEKHSGYLTAHHKEWQDTMGAFVARSPAVRGDVTAMYYARLGKVTHTDILGRWREVADIRRITRDEFDRITGIDQIRRDLGWRDYE